MPLEQPLFEFFLKNDELHDPLITADHGNIEQMTDPQSGGAHTAHTTNLVPFVACSDALVGRSLKSGGRLCDIATTLLPLLGLEKSPEMEGVDLLV